MPKCPVSTTARVFVVIKGASLPTREGRFVCLILCSLCGEFVGLRIDKNREGPLRIDLHSGLSGERDERQVVSLKQAGFRDDLEV